ncbi:MAG: hypothetical protein Q8O55_01900 [Dehalococcoidales bacterium]|nr:hypothetical protein [Dehalococcoidales bacterium]
MNIKDIENHIDQVWGNLAICRFSLHLALFMVLSVFENKIDTARNMVLEGELDRRLADGGLVHLRDSLQTLIPQIFEKCNRARFREKDILVLRGLRTFPLPAYEASDFSQRYQWFAYHITSYHQDLLNCSVDGRVLTFSFPKNINIGSALMHHALNRFHEEVQIDKDRLSKLYMRNSYKEITEKLRLSLRHKNIRQFLYSIPPDMLNDFKEMVDSSAPQPTIQEDLAFETYSIGDYYNFWKHLSALMICYLQACKVKYSPGSNRLLYSRVLILTPDEIVEAVSSSGEVSADVCSNIVKDFTLDIYSQRPDIQVRYIIPVHGSDYVYLSPTLVFTSSWEVCLLRNWAKMSHDKYGAVVASKKSRLADQLAKHFEGNDIITAIRRNIFSSEQKLLGDIDLAVFDKNSGYLAIVELKWVLRPDSFQEHSHAREEINQGINQLERIINQYERNSNLILKQLFSDQSIEAKMVTEVQYFLICDGDIEHYDKAESMGINVLDYQLCIDMLITNPGDATRERFKKMIDRNLAYAQASADDLCYHTMKIAGYAFRTPGLRGTGRQYIQEAYDRVPPLPKSSCYCGSGIAYQDCCQLVESIEEAPIDYVQ